MDTDSKVKSWDDDEYEGESGLVTRWLHEIKHARESASYQRFLKDGEQAIKVYRNQAYFGQHEDQRTARVTYNLLWSTIQTLKPAYYARMPKVVADRRLKSKNPISLLACQIAERCTSFSLSVEENQFNESIKNSVEDRLLPGLGVAMVTFDAQIEEQLDEAGQVLSEGPAPGSEKTETKYIHWKDFWFTPGRIWDEVYAAGYRCFLTRDELIEKYGEDIGKQVSLNYEPNQIRDSGFGEDFKKFFKKAEIWIVWDKKKKQVLHISEGYKDKPLKVIPDPWKLDGFFPVAMPLFATTTTDDLTPTSDYRIVQSVLEEIDEVVKRLTKLRGCVRYVGAHDAAVNDDIKGLAALMDGETWPVKRWADFSAAKGFNGLIDWLPMEQVAKVMNELTKYLEWLLGKYWELSGIPDIVRGNSNPSETATAQQYKGQFATLRIAEKQSDVQRFCRDLIDKKAQIIFELFSDEMIMAMSGYDEMDPDEQAIFPQALALLRNDTMRQFKIDIETDSTLAIDEQADRTARMEFLQALGTIMNQSFQMMQVRPELTNPMLESIMFAVRGFRAGRGLEASLQKAMDDIQAADEAAKQAQAEAANQPPPVDPAEMKAQADQMIAQMEMQLEQEKAANKAQIDQMLAQHKAGLDNFKVQAELDLKHKELEYKTALKAQEIRTQMAEQLAQAPMQQQAGLIEELKSKRENLQPVIVNVTIPSGRKAIKFATDPTTGERVGIAEDLPSDMQ